MGPSPVWNQDKGGCPWWRPLLYRFTIYVLAYPFVLLDPRFDHLAVGPPPLWEVKQRQGPMIEISAIQVEDLHIWRSFGSNLPNVWPVRCGSSSLSSPTQRLEPTMESLGHSGEGWFEDESKKVSRNYENALFDHVDLTDPYSHGVSLPCTFPHSSPRWMCWLGEISTINMWSVLSTECVSPR